MSDNICMIQGCEQARHLGYLTRTGSVVWLCIDHRPPVEEDQEDES